MFNSFYTIALIAALTIFAGPALAQVCQGPFETITQLERPIEASYAVWNAQYGEKTIQEKFDAGATSAAGNAVLAGFAKDEKGKPSLLLVEVNQRGRAIWEKKSAIGGIEKITKMFVRKGAYVLLADQKDGVWIGWFNSKGGLIRQSRIAEQGTSLSGRDLIASNDGKGYVLAATSKPKNGPLHAVLYRLNEQGEAQGSRSYMPGLENSLQAVVASGNGYIAAGALRGENGMNAGWLMRLTDDLALDWQRQYPQRGPVSIGRVSVYNDTHIVTAGQAGTALWLMGLDSSGSPQWQRFYMGKDRMLLRDMLPYGDGRVSVLAESYAMPEVPDYAMMLTVSPYGGLLQTEMFNQMESVSVSDIFEGAQGQRGVAGFAHQTVKLRDPEKPEAEPVTVRDLNGWVLSAVPSKSAAGDCDAFKAEAAQKP